MAEKADQPSKILHKLRSKFRFKPRGQESLLCLKCRGSGHLARKCTAKEKWPNDQYGWFLSPARRPLGQRLRAAKDICQRCKNLNLVQLLREQVPWRSREDLERAHKEGHPLIIKIGQADTIEFRSTCPVCVCLFAITPAPVSSKDNVLIYPDWTINRLIGDKAIQMDREEKRRYTSCLLVAVVPNDSLLSPEALRSDAMCILEQDLTSTETLGGRTVHSEQFNLDVAKSWLKTCQKLHGTDCSPDYTDDLRGVRFVDVKTREIVPYPGSPCEYAALSYVWGGVKEQSYQLGSQLGTVSKTIEDAITCTQLLSIRFLWVDALCIDQFDENDKLDQIVCMRSIYRGSSITLIALSSDSANSGLPRFSPELEPQPQFSCTIDGVRLLSLMPSLWMQVRESIWDSRAWTLQEAVLSHRCLFLSDHQLYFECEAMQCCESLDERRSWAHNLTVSACPNPREWLAWVRDENGPGCLRKVLDRPDGRLQQWVRMVYLYSDRSMTKDGDALLEFTGILQDLQAVHTEGFFWGLPLEDFQWALLWQSQTAPRRRQGYPTWCWAGCSGGGIFTLLSSRYMRDPHRTPVPLRIWKAVADKLVLIFDAEARATATLKNSGDNGNMVAKNGTADRQTESTQNETKAQIFQSTLESAMFETSQHSRREIIQQETEDGNCPAKRPATYDNIEHIFGLPIHEDGKEHALFMEVFTVQLPPDWGKSLAPGPRALLQTGFLDTYWWRPMHALCSNGQSYQSAL